MSQPATISDDPPTSYPQLVATYGFLPNLFQVQSTIPQAIEAEQRLIETVVVRQDRLSRHQKAAILNGVATVRGSDYCRALFWHSFTPAADPSSALLDFCLKLGKHGPWVSGADLLKPKTSGFDEKAIADFYHGKTVRIVVGFSAGGGYDQYSRLIARHLGKYIPGSPAVIVDNMAGAGSIIAANHTFNAAPKDGTVIGNISGPIINRR